MHILLNTAHRIYTSDYCKPNIYLSYQLVKDQFEDYSNQVLEAKVLSTGLLNQNFKKKSPKLPDKPAEQIQQKRQVFCIFPI